MARRTVKPLSEKQKEVLAVLGGDKTIGEVAEALGITESGVYGHIRRIKAAGHEVPALRRPSADELITPGPAENNGGVAGADYKPEMAYSVLEEAGLRALEAERALLDQARKDLEAVKERGHRLEEEIQVRTDRIETIERVNKDLADRQLRDEAQTAAA